MTYKVLAIKWRPKNFNEIIGQEHITKSLQNAIKHNRISHAFTFSGPRGVGKTTTARILARELNEVNRTMMYVPKGFAHGFQTLVDNVELLYLHSEFYSKEHEDGLLYNDKAIDIDWPLPVSEISERDKVHPMLSELNPIRL